MEQLNLTLAVNRNDAYDLSKITQLIREGWDMVHIDDSTEVKGKDTKVVLVRKI
jgi:hypothetical protein